MLVEIGATMAVSLFRGLSLPVSKLGMNSISC
jgi:hypothetical protein